MLTCRIAGGGLVMLARITALRSNPDGNRTEVVVAAPDPQLGTVLTPNDVQHEKGLATTQRFPMLLKPT